VCEKRERNERTEVGHGEGSGERAKRSGEGCVGERGGEGRVEKGGGTGAWRKGAEKGGAKDTRREAEEQEVKTVQRIGP